jgi:ribosomal protein S18 acetylase RimI-like enzyme
MQLANSQVGDPILHRHVRRATRADAAAVQRLLRMGVYIHLHVDWRLPGEWLGRPGFVVYDKSPDVGDDRRAGTARVRPANIAGCMAVTADPLPAAWVRVAAADSVAGFAQSEAMFAAILAELDPAVDEIAWFITDNWPLHWLDRLGFHQVSTVLAYRKEKLDYGPFAPPPGLEVRPVLIEELPALAAIEAAAFEPRWRHSAESLYLAWRQSASFDVALLEGEPVGFQFSTGHNGNAHLVRMTVRPDRQGMGVGAALLAHTLDGYRQRRLETVTLNTQADNLASQRLYERFGFRPTGSRYPVWSYYPTRG